MGLDTQSKKMKIPYESGDAVELVEFFDTAGTQDVHPSEGSETTGGRASACERVGPSALASPHPR